MKNNIIGAALAAVISLTVPAATWASIVVGGTRVIYPAESRDVSVRVSNNGEVPALVQSWVDAGDPNVKPEDLDVPFTVTPSVYRLDPGKTQMSSWPRSASRRRRRWSANSRPLSRAWTSPEPGCR